MEIVIDAKLVRAIVGDEHARALGEIRALGPVTAYQASRLRHDQRLAAAKDAATLACAAGCAWCCHFPVDVRAVEAFAIVEFMKRELPSNDVERLRTEILANRDQLRGLDDLQRMQRNQKCVFLQDNRCSIYPARPQTCRNYHATDAAGCERSFNEPHNLDIDPDFAPAVYQAGGAHVDAFAASLAEHGFDTGAYELNAALATVFEEADACRRRFDAGEPPFPGIDRLEVTPEFLDIE